MPDPTPINIAYLSYDGLTDPLGQSQIMPYLAGLSKLNYRFTIFSFEKPDRFKKLQAEIHAGTAACGIDWIPLSYHKNPPIVSTLVDLWILWNGFKKSHAVKRFQIVHCRSYVTALIGLRARRQLKVKFIFDMRGFWADERVEGGIWNMENPLFKIIYNFFKRKEIEFLGTADYIISLTESAKKEIESWPIQVGPIAVIPTCVDLELFDPKKIKTEDQDVVRGQLGIAQHDFVLLYLGSWGTWYMTSEMLGFFSALKSRKPNAKFLVLSADSIDLSHYQHKNDVIVTAVPRSRIPLFVSLANASIFFIKPTFSKKASSATKLGEILAMNVPVVTNRGWGDVEMIAQRTPAISLIETSNYDAEIEEQGSGREFCEACLGLQGGITTYSMVYSNLAPL